MNHEGTFRTTDAGDLLMYGREAFFQYFRDNPSSQFIYKVEKVSKGSSNKLTAYFHAEVLPKLIIGFRDTGENHNIKSIKEEIKKYSPVMEGEKNWEDLSYFEKHRCIEELIIFAAENLEIVIDNPQ